MHSTALSQHKKKVNHQIDRLFVQLPLTFDITYGGFKRKNSVQYCNVSISNEIEHGLYCAALLSWAALIIYYSNDYRTHTTTSCSQFAVTLEQRLQKSRLLLNSLLFDNEKFFFDLYALVLWRKYCIRQIV